jgi:elongation factor Ts
LRVKEYSYFIQLWGFLMAADRKRAVLINLNAETDFVAKGDDFKEFLSGTLKLLLDKQLEADLSRGSPDLEGFLNDCKFNSSNTLNEMTKLLTAKTKEKIEFSKIHAFKSN